MKLDLDKNDVRSLRKVLRYVAAHMTEHGSCDEYDLLKVTETETACIEDILLRLDSGGQR